MSRPEVNKSSKQNFIKMILTKDQRRSKRNKKKVRIRKNSRNINITKCSKIWLNKECDKNLAKYQVSRGKTNWIKYKKSVRTAKRIFFNNRIQEIVSTNKRP